MDRWTAGAASKHTRPISYTKTSLLYLSKGKLLIHFLSRWGKEAELFKVDCDGQGGRGTRDVSFKTPILCH